MDQLDINFKLGSDIVRFLLEKDHLGDDGRKEQKTHQLGHREAPACRPLQYFVGEMIMEQRGIDSKLPRFVIINCSVGMCAVSLF